MLRLVELSLSMQRQFEEFCRALETEQDRRRWLFEYQGEPFDRLVTKLRDWKQGRQLPAGWVRCAVYYLVNDDGLVLGKSSLRYELNDFLWHIGGHIGYIIRADQRRKGCGTAILRLTLEKAALLGLKRVLVTCDADNIASAKIVEKNGGVLENVYQDAEMAVPKRRYWIELQQEASNGCD